MPEDVQRKMGTRLRTQPAMRIQIICQDNFYGLTKDRQVIASVLTDHELVFNPPAKAFKGTFDVNFHLEHIVFKNTTTAPINIAIPNPEWCSRPMYNALGSFTAVFAKTRHSEAIFNGLKKCPVYYTGWTSPDPYDQTVERKKHIAHIAGLSPLKSTHAVVEAMQHLPNIRGTCYYRRGSIGNTPNFEHIKKPVSDQVIKEAINSSGIHVLPSQAEGWGHMINEALACGATVITTDAPPMNTFGAQYHVKTTGSHPHNLAQAYHLDPTDLRRCIQDAWDNYTGFDMDARAEYLRRDRLFKARFGEAFDQLFPSQAA